MGLKDWWAEIKRKALKETTRRAAEKAADSALDDLEAALLGEVGAAEDILEDQNDVDPLDRLRAAHDLEPDAAPVQKKAPTLADAQAELERLKAEQAKK